MAVAGEKCPTFSKNASRLRVVYVETFREGMARWRLAVAELLALAEMTGAKFVEPCVVDGRLYGACGPGMIRLREVFELPDSVVPYEVFAASNLSSTKRRSLCLHKSRAGCGLWPWGYRNALSCPAASAGAQILVIHEYFRGGTWGLDKHSYNRALASLEFADGHADRARELVREVLGSARPYAAFQWRSETRHAHLDECASHLIRSKAALGLSNETPVVLVSDLTTTPGLQWYGIQRADADKMRRTLDVLRAHNFRKIEDVVPPGAADLVFMAVWDALAGVLAHTFVTCASCPESPVCTSCTWPSQYAKLIVDMRKETAANTTFTCWL